MAQPAHPLFTVSLKPCCCIEFRREAENHAHVTRLALLLDADAHCITFDAAGSIWSFRYERPPGGFSALSRILAHTFYNPFSSVAVTWTHVREYSLEELRQYYLDAIAADDDILTQFVDHDELSARVRACSTYQDFVATWEWQNTVPPFDEESESRASA